ncbi:PAS domain-containing protein [Aliiglaciecola sp. CAU 1673]|uniref:PAS domain-containing protein n=1 Tax=Aliiglaciecola sp. CAU 1673 TaxID=3032595 RepID=UPI0023DBC305|nr:PAS domain-containing protein [Aliiglaciecola sp. CAU 1673]MDF2178590.1 PAS domain-containing protein [Aliiglaciecola sp. CAU 1673]
MMNKPSFTLLLIEGDVVLAGRLQWFLDALSAPCFKVSWSRDSQDAKRLLKMSHFDIVLLDITDDAQNGLEYFKEIQALAPRSLLILLCAKKDILIALQAMTLGANDYLDKARIDNDLLGRVLRYNLASRQTNNVLNISIAGFRAVGEACPMGIVVLDLSGQITYTNRAYQSITGYSSGQLLGRFWADAIHPWDRLRVQREWRQVHTLQRPFNTEMRILHKNQSIRLVRINGAFLHEGNILQGHVRLLEDITAQATEGFSDLPEVYGQALPEEAQRFALRTMHEAVLVTDFNSRVTYLNSVAQQITGWSSAQGVERSLAEVFNIRDALTGVALDDTAHLAMASNQTMKLAKDCILTRRDGSETLIENVAAPLHNKVGEVCGAVLIFRDASQSYAGSANRVKSLQHDLMTGPPNCQLSEKGVNQAIEQAELQHKPRAVFHLSVRAQDHEIGGELASRISTEVMSRIKETIQEKYSLYHLGNGEYVILLANIARPDDVEIMFDSLRTRLSIPCVIDQKEVKLTLRSGMKLYPNDSANWQELLSQAAIAIKNAKPNALKQCHLYKNVSHY